jgi:hypothetical protein
MVNLRSGNSHGRDRQAGICLKINPAGWAASLHHERTQGRHHGAIVGTEPRGRDPKADFGTIASLLGQSSKARIRGYSTGNDQ